MYDVQTVERRGDIMGKYKRLKKAHDNLQEEVDHLVRVLKLGGSLNPHCGMCDNFIEGRHGVRIDQNQTNVKGIQFRIGKLEEFLGIELKHTDKWNYKERENTDGN